MNAPCSHRIPRVRRTRKCGGTSERVPRLAPGFNLGGLIGSALLLCRPASPGNSLSLQSSALRASRGKPLDLCHCIRKAGRGDAQHGVGRKLLRHQALLVVGSREICDPRQAFKNFVRHRFLDLSLQGQPAIMRHKSLEVERETVSTASAPTKLPECHARVWPSTTGPTRMDWAISLDG